MIRSNRMSASNPLPTSQERLYRALLADIERASVLLSNSRPSESVIQEITGLLNHIRRMEGHIQDPNRWQAIHTRADELNRMLTLLQ